MTAKDPHEQYWFNMRTHEVEHGRQSLASELVGPFDTAEEASHALEKLRENAKAWDDEESAERG